MAEILKEWLSQRLQRSITWKAEEFGDKMKNGHIISCVLRNYNIINDEQHFLIKPSNLNDDLKSNWKLIKLWLSELEIHLNDEDLENIMSGKGSTILRLFYQLFLYLDKRDRTNFIKQERKTYSTLVEKLEHRFNVNKVKESREPFFDNLSKPLLDENQYIQWQKEKSKEIKETYDYLRHHYLKTLTRLEEAKTPLQYQAPMIKKMTEKNKKDMEEFSLKYPCEFHNYTYEELCELDKKATEKRQPFIDSDWAKNYIDNLYSKMHKKADTEEFQKQISNVISRSLWDMSIAEEESKLDIELAKKVMKLSQFEKQMCTQIMETKQQARNLVKNRIAGEEEFSDQRTQQFNQYLDNLKEEINLGLVEIDFEKQRQNMLHKKLYAEKMKRKRQHYYDICYDTILSIIDYATKYAYFKRLLEGDIPNHFINEWKILYYKQQPIFDYVEPMENVLKESTTEEHQVSDYDEILHLELDRQEILNENEFLDYHNYLYPWKLELLIPNYDPESEDRKYEYLGSRILGHIVYSLLEIKYPYPPQRLPATLPDYTAKAIVRCLPDNLITIAMQTLLLAQKIHVVRLESAVNFCLRRFKTEMIGCTDIELSFDKFIASAQEEEEKDFIKLLKSEDEIMNKNSEANVSLVSGPLIANTKQTQTPKAIPEEDITLTYAAELGRYVYECLNSGNILTDHLLCAIIVEYLKDQDNINGFVIINYPNSYRQAKILEETFSGRAPPDEEELDDQDNIYLEESLIHHRKKDKDPYKEERTSKLVNDPHKKLSDQPFISYFTCYIKLKETEDILREFVIWSLNEENSDLIDRFYATLGINYSMYYEVIEKEQLGLICKYIIGDFTMPLKSNDKLFGENVLSILDFPSSDDKRTKSKIVKPETSNGKSKERLRRNSKLSRLSSLNELDILKAPESIDETQDEMMIEKIDEEENESKTYDTALSAEEVKLMAGEEDWIYGKLPIAETIGIALATCWEEIEKSYIHDIQHLFFGKRLQMNCLIPYTRFLKDKMEQTITLPSRKQDLVKSFHQEYNNFENDWRDIHLTKNEWHCKIKELQNKLYKICDERKRFAEKQRQSLICENWAMEEMTTMVNTYISCMQAELNRAILTYQILHDFYFAMIKRSPASDRLTSKELTKIFKETDETSGSKKGGEDKIYRQLKTSFQEMQLNNIEIDFSNNPFNFIIENNVKFALKVVKDTNDSYRSLISREYSEIAKIVPVTKKKEENTSEESLNEEEVFKVNALKCIDEWIMGINGEMFRVNLRLLALQYKCYKDMKLFNDNICRAFTDIQNDINNYYLNEIKSVDRLCKYVQMAVEEGKRIPDTLALEEDMFIIDPNLLQFSESNIEVDDVVNKEFVTDMQFKISHLAQLRSQFKIVAPTGLILQQAFIYLLQDFIFFGRESCDGPMFPEAWKRIDAELIPKLVFLLFGETTYIDWKDFLIHCLNMQFPTLEELLLYRKYFRCNDLQSTELIQRDIFIEKELWFEKDFDPLEKGSLLRKYSIKHFLFELFETAENVMNYSAFLLALCKSFDPIEGFVMALSMAIGKKICYKIADCEEVVCKLIKDKKYRDECLLCAHKCTGQFLDKLIVNVINICEGITITELEYTEPLPETDKKGKKGKGGAKAKKIESTQSARIPKVQKSLTSRSKTAQSVTDVKTTYICRPCEEETEIAEEKSPKIEDVIEEPIVEPQEDPDLVYAVSQSVIWKVLKICLPSYFDLLPEVGTTPYLEQVKEVLKRLEDDTDDKDIYVCKFVSDPNVCKMLHKTKKFAAVNLANEILKISM